MSILLYGCTTWTLTKRMEKKMDGDYTRMLQAILNKSWTQHPYKEAAVRAYTTHHENYQIWRSIHAEHCWRSRDEVISDILLWTPSHGWANAGRPARTYIQRSVPIQHMALKTYREQWTIDVGGKRRSGRCMRKERKDDEDYIYFSFLFS